MTAKEALESLVERLAVKKVDRSGNLVYWRSTTDTEYKVIESALNRLNELEKDNKSLKTALSVYEQNHEQALKEFCEQKDKITELEKVLKIIKEKDVNIVLFKDAIRYFNDELGYYNANVMDNHRKLTETEFNLLRWYLI